MEYLRENAKLRKVVDLIKDTAEVEIKDDKDKIDVSKTAEEMVKVIEDEEAKKAAEETKEDKE